MKKKVISLLLTAVMAASLLAGCGKKEEPAAANNDAPATQEESTPADDSAEGNDADTLIRLENHKTLMGDKVFFNALENSLLLAIGFISIQYSIAIVVAAVLDKL